MVTLTLCQRTGTTPGTASENVGSISWKAVDDVATSYDDSSAILGVGTNSYTVYSYFKFTGIFTTVANVKITRYTGSINPKVKLASSATLVSPADRLSYATPTRNIDNTNLTPVNLTSIGSSINLMVGSAPSGQDGAAYSGKSNSASNTGDPIYTNYFVTQLQVSSLASTGDLNNVTLQITYDES
jgi:hypothetical protein